MLTRTHLILAGLAVSCLAVAVVAADKADKKPTSGEVISVSSSSATTRPTARFRSLTSEQEEELLEFLREKGSERYEQLLKLRKSDPRSYKRQARTLYWFMQRVKSMPAQVQKSYVLMTELNVHIWRTVREIRQATNDAQKQKLIAELRDLIARRFEPEQVVREYQITQMEERIKRLREQLKDNAGRREAVIDEMLGRYLKLTTRPMWSSHAGHRPERPATSQPTTRPVNDAATQPAKAAGR